MDNVAAENEYDVDLSTPFWEFPTRFRCGRKAVVGVLIFLLPFGSFDVARSGSTRMLMNVALSTPFWEFRMEAQTRAQAMQ